MLARHTSEAARRFRLARRGVIAPGAAADLVLWSLPGTEAPRDLKDCRPVRVILDGRALDLEAPELPRAGRFLGR